MAKEITAKKQSFINLYNQLPLLPPTKAQEGFLKFADFRRALKKSIIDYVDSVADIKEHKRQALDEYYKKDVEVDEKKYIELKAKKKRTPEEEKELISLMDFLQASNMQQSSIGMEYDVKLAEEFKAQAEEITITFDNEDFIFVKDLMEKNIADLCFKKSNAGKEIMDLELADEMLELFETKEKPKK